jgi:Entner-Doudoroff aldolase
MDKIDIIKKLGEEKLVAVIRAESKEQGLKIVDAVQKGGIHFLEITMTVPGAIDVIKTLVEENQNPDVVIGAGTVLDPETARAVILAGAKFVVSPCFSEDVIKTCNRYRVPVMTGAQTINEIVMSLELGVDVVKVFPGDAYSPSIIKSFKGPLPQANFMPTGGVSVDNVNDWLASGAYAVGTGSSLTQGAKENDFDKVVAEAKKFVEAVKKGN